MPTVVKATRALSAVAFLVSTAIAVGTPPARAGHPPNIVVEPVLSRLDNGISAVRVSIANESSLPIAIDPDAIEVFRRRGAIGPRAWDTYAVVTWHRIGSAKRSRVVSGIKRVSGSSAPGTND